MSCEPEAAEITRNDAGWYTVSEVLSMLYMVWYHFSDSENDLENSTSNSG